MNKNWLKIGIPVGVLLLLIVYGFWPRAILVNAAYVKKADMTVTIEAEGKTRVIDRYVITAPVPGVACRQDMNVGDPVTQDQVLYQLDPLQSEVLDPRSRATAEANVKVAQAALKAAQQRAEAARADAEYAATELQRIEKLVSAGHATRELLDKARTTARSSSAAQRSADFAVDVARYELDAARTALEYSAAKSTSPTHEHVPIRSPIDGQILLIHRKCEGVVMTGTPLIEVGDTRRLEVEIDVLSEDAVRITQGMPVFFNRWGGDDALEGRVRTIEPVGFTKISALGVEEQRVLVITDFVSPYETWTRLGDGYRVDASFILWQGKQVLQIPTSALFRVDGQWMVFVIDSGKATAVAVKLGERSGLIAQVLDGLQEGQQIITHPDDRIREGVRVRPRE